MFGVSVGIIAALKRGKWQDRSIMAFALFGYSFPSFFIGLLLVFFVQIKWGLVGYEGYVPFFDSPSLWFQGLILPWIALALLYAAFYARLTRNQMLETLGEDYIRTARAKGLKERTVIGQHALRAGLTPIVTAAGLDLAGLLGGAVITEAVFNLPGIGRLSIDSVTDSDLPVITATVLIAATFVIVANLVVDCLVRRHRPPGEAHVTQAFLDVRDLRVQFPTEDGLVNAVDGVDFSVEKGKTLAIVGESGSGKSVTSQAIMGLINRKTAKMTGEVYLDGEELVGARPEQVRSLRGKRMAMIFQDPLSSLHPFYSIGKQLAEAVLVHQKVSKSEAYGQARDMLARVGIPNPERRIKDYPHNLSGGMRQRVMIAMALLNSPELLIADEPTTALDVTVQAQILDLLRDLQDEFGTAIVLITHDLGVVADMADDVVVMYGGRVVERGSVQDIYYRPEMPYTWGLLGSVPRMDVDRGERLQPIPGQPPSLIRLPKGCVFRPRCPYHELCRATGATPTARPWSRSRPSTRCAATSSRPSGGRSPRSGCSPAAATCAGGGADPDNPDSTRWTDPADARPAAASTRATTQEDPK